jgi:hypothetical protein
MVLYAYVLCLCILVLPRIPWYDLGRQTPHFGGGSLIGMHRATRGVVGLTVSVCWWWVGRDEWGSLQQREEDKDGWRWVTWMDREEFLMVAETNRTEQDGSDLAKSSKLWWQAKTIHCWEGGERLQCNIFDERTGGGGTFAERRPMT